jgi:hypothetical protein
MNNLSILALVAVTNNNKANKAPIIGTIKGPPGTLKGLGTSGATIRNIITPRFTKRNANNVPTDVNSAKTSMGSNADVIAQMQPVIAVVT